jgi:arylsulfatase A-like enzyme
VIVLGRGGLQVKPISVGLAFRGPNMALGHLALNPVFTVAEALYGKRDQVFRFYPDEEALRVTRGLIGLPDPPLEPRYPLLHRFASPPPERRKNVVILTIESFSAQLTKTLGDTEGVTPNFDALAREGLLFSNFYASGTRSIEGIAAILTGYPALPNAPLIGSSLAQNRLESLPLLLKARGYHTLFLHGAFRGSMWFDQFADGNGFDRYIAKEDFPDAAAISDGEWGIFDGYSLERLHRELASSAKPVFAFYFSLSSHTPFRLPDPRFAVFGPQVAEARKLNSFHYMDYALGHFFALARQSDYWRDTVFLITADHNYGGAGLDARARMWIPLLILDPGDPDFPRGKVDTSLGSQADIAPTVLDLLHLTALTNFAGHSLLRPASHRYALFAWGGQAGWLDEEALVIHDLQRPLALYHWRTDPGLAHNLLATGAAEAGRPGVKPGPVHDFQAYLQTVNNLLMENRVYPAQLPAPAGQAGPPPGRLAAK